MKKGSIFITVLLVIMGMISLGQSEDESDASLGGLREGDFYFFDIDIPAQKRFSISLISDDSTQSFVLIESMFSEPAKIRFVFQPFIWEMLRDGSAVEDEMVVRMPLPVLDYGMFSCKYTDSDTTIVTRFGFL